MRGLGWYDKNFSQIKSLKNKYKGKRCFIACTGPSLTIDDLELLKNEYVFGMNSICLIHDKTDWRPDFFGIQDVYVFEKLKDTILQTDNGLVFIPIELRDSYELPKTWINFYRCWAYNVFKRLYSAKYFAKFSNNAYARVYDGFSITFSIMQIAVYMGFDEIYLIGADCNYLGQKQHFIESGHYDINANTAGDRMIGAYVSAKKYADNHGILIYNATRGGCLEIFTRIKLEDVINKREKNKLN